uniref:Secreted protein n=1 Tax=Heterorhabditis bacteriophora TaxID=37862 RepID=A0A1I7XDG3_HETBA
MFELLFLTYYSSDFNASNFLSVADADNNAVLQKCIRVPEQNRMVGTYDPNYQTLAGLNNNDVFKEKTLAAINANCFGEDKKKTIDEKDRWCTY